MLEKAGPQSFDFPIPTYTVRLRRDESVSVVAAGTGEHTGDYRFESAGQHAR